MDEISPQDLKTRLAGSDRPLLLDVTHVAPCYAYRGQEPGESEDAYGARLAAELDAEIVRLGSASVMAW